MLQNKFLLATLVLLVTVAVLLTIAGVRAGDEGGGGAHNIILPLL